MPGRIKNELKLGDKTYFITKLTDLDMQELDLYVKKQFVQSVYDTLPESLSAEERQFAIQQAQITAAGLTFMSGQGVKIMASVPGMTRLTWQLLHKEHPDLTIEELHDVLLDPANIEKVNASFAEVHHTGKKLKRDWHNEDKKRQRKKERQNRRRKN